LLSICFFEQAFAIPLPSIHRDLPSSRQDLLGFRGARLKARAVLGSGFRNAAALASFPTLDQTLQTLSNKGLQQTWRSLALAPRS
jgi:hypothetical protein